MVFHNVGKKQNENYTAMIYKFSHNVHQDKKQHQLTIYQLYFVTNQQ